MKKYHQKLKEKYRGENGEMDLCMKENQIISQYRRKYALKSMV